jgi:hypothetical protein
MKLMGMPAITVTTTAQTGIRPVNNYLKKVVRLMGMITVGEMTANAYRPGVFLKRNYYKAKYLGLAKKVIKILEGRKSIHPSLKNIVYFHALQLTYKTMQQHYLYPDMNANVQRMEIYNQRRKNNQ